MPITTPEPVVLVHINFGDPDYAEDAVEFQQLAESAGFSGKFTVSSRRAMPDVRYFIGSGKADELLKIIDEHQIKTVLFNHELSPAQERNLERFLNCTVMDKTRLVLEIFAKRAKTYEGKLQVELAQLSHLATRLIRLWTHLEGQKGGIGLRSGPGETQLELDRRLIRNKIKQLKARLQKLKKQRAMQRRARQRSEVMTVSLVGYTNAGKSTLFNLMTQAKTYAHDQLFATLDTSSRKLSLPFDLELPHKEIVISDTVGFIKNLPHVLISAFSATLEEVSQVDLLLHVVNVANPNRAEQIHHVNQVLKEISADHIPQIIIFNQIDRGGLPAQFLRDEEGNIVQIHLSAKTGEGKDYLRLALQEWLGNVLS